MFTLAELDAALPAQMRGKMTPELANRLNTVLTDEHQAKNFRDNFISYTKVLSEGKFKLEDYMNAVAYVGFKLMGYSDRECFQKTFPDKYQELVAKGTPTKDIASYVSAYNRNKLVNLILEQTLVPSYVLNQDIYQKAINIQADLMMNAKREDVRQKAADSLLNHLKKPEASKVELNVNMKDSQEVEDLKASMAKLIEQQQTMIGNGFSTRDIAHQRIIDVTPN